MKVIIIEDEKPAAEKLKKSLLKADSNIEIMAVHSSVKESVAWLSEHPLPELIFMDIQLSDGLSFQIVEKSKIECPVIFTTAYDEYWQEAFEHNSIDYLLKPVKQDKLEIALKKFAKMKKYFSSSYQNLTSWQQKQGNEFKKRFLVKRGLDYISIKVEDIAYFYAAHKLVCMVGNNGQKYILDQSLSEIEKQINPVIFYRVNRKYLLNITAIKRIKTYPRSKIQLDIDPSPGEEIIISQENVSAFKEWISS